MTKTIKTIALATCFILAAGCSGNFPLSVKANDPKPSKYSAWITYWDAKNGEKELLQIKSKIDNLSYFAAYFGENDKLIVPKNIKQLKKNFDKKRLKQKSYLTFVNDVKLPNDQILLKDIDLLRRLFATDESIYKHIESIIKIAKEASYDGIEIDYERIWVDENVGIKFSVFINILAQECIKNNLALRVVLEPGIPFEKNIFANGPEYVVMMYNLYGTHSGPGPKADRSFIKRVIDKMQWLPEEKAVAFSNGGCIWGTDGSKKFITQEEAEALAEKYKPEIEIDTESAAKYFQYNGENGYLYTVWYADSQTINFWIATARANGISNVSIWRLGGNVKIEELKTYKDGTP